MKNLLKELTEPLTALKILILTLMQMPKSKFDKLKQKVKAWFKK